MKKQFTSLFIAMAFLLGTSAFASVPHTPFTTGGMVGANASNLLKGINRGLYHITNVDPTGNPLGVLYVDVTDADAGKVTVEDPTQVAGTRFLGEALWCVDITTELQGQNPAFSFINKAYGDNLRAIEDSVSVFVLDGPLTSWKFSDVYGKGVKLDTIQPLYSYIDGNRAVVLVEGDNPGEVKTIIANVADIETSASALITAINDVDGNPATLLYFTLSEAAPMVLTAADFNTKLGTEPTAKGQKLGFAPDATVGDNPFSENVLTATDVPGGTAGTADWYLNLSNQKGDTLRVDTTLVNATGSYFLDFLFTDTIATNLADQYAFRFVYFPSHDSLIINVKSALQPSKSQEALGKEFFSEYIGLNNTIHGAREGELVSMDDVYGPNDTLLIDFTYVILQDLNKDQIVTIGELPSQTAISFGLGGCSADVSKTSLQGLYTIRNTEGKYLQIPIYTDSIPNAYQWVTLEKNVDPMQMPSFQWVVEKVRENDTDNTSPVIITNREYGVSLGRIQLREDVELPLAGAFIGKDTTAFKEVGKTQRLDPYLGYKHVDVNVAKLNTYTFNYLHELAEDKYMSVKNDENDSLLHVTDDKDAFELVNYHHYDAAGKITTAPVGYGYTGTLDATYAADLVRTAYVLKVKEGSKIKNVNKIVVIGDEERYAVTPGDNYAIAEGDSAVFYLKVNNTKALDEGNIRNYYALVDTSSLTKDISQMITVKAGVADHNMWVKAQNHYEIRTSAFAVEESEAPLYRRFNREVDGQDPGHDKFYDGAVDTDSPVKLRFHRMNNISELLYEDSHSVYSEGKGIRFLGVKHAADFEDDVNLEERTTFYVDTAYVRRPAIKGAEKDTPKPQYLLGFGVVNVKGETIEDPCAPDVETPDYKRGRYLINATDSVYGIGANWASRWTATGPNTILNEKYIWDTKWERLAFVNAVKLNDTLYILNGQTYADPVNFDALKADARVRAIRLDNNLHKDVVFSFRLIENEDVSYADQKQNFLIESETTERGESPMIAPMNGGWVKIQNGVPVISRGAYYDAITEAERFNVLKSDADAVANEGIDVVGVKVIASEGKVTILNAAGKNVMISNILGQVVANTVLASDNAAIAAPKGIVVVAVEGESAVKAIVK